MVPIMLQSSADSHVIAMIVLLLDALAAGKLQRRRKKSWRAAVIASPPRCRYLFKHLCDLIQAWIAGMIRTVAHFSASAE